MRPHGWVGLGVILGAEVLLFRGAPVVGQWFTPIVWTGYVVFVDAVVARRTGESYLTTRRGELVGVALASIGCWWLFEWYNAPRFWRAGPDRAGLWWQYEHLVADPFLRRVGYDWAFATIFPALFLTARALETSIFSGLRARPARPSAPALALAVAAGGVCVVLPLVVVSRWLAPLVWIGWFLLLEPINYRLGSTSWLRSLERGVAAPVASLLASGLVCGVLWEFWNYWAETRWTYTVPYWGQVKVFEMPLAGYLGFPPFALECYAMYNFLRFVFADHLPGGRP